MKNYNYKLFTEPDCKVTKQLISILTQNKIRGSIIDLTSKEANREPISFKVLNIPTLVMFNEKDEVIEHIFSAGELKEFINKQ